MLEAHSCCGSLCCGSTTQGTMVGYWPIRVHRVYICVVNKGARPVARVVPIGREIHLECFCSSCVSQTQQRLVSYSPQLCAPPTGVPQVARPPTQPLAGCKSQLQLGLHPTQCCTRHFWLPRQVHPVSDCEDWPSPLTMQHPAVCCSRSILDHAMHDAGWQRTMVDHAMVVTLEWVILIMQDKSELHFLRKQATKLPTVVVEWAQQLVANFVTHDVFCMGLDQVVSMLPSGTCQNAPAAAV